MKIFAILTVLAGSLFCALPAQENKSFGSYNFLTAENEQAKESFIDEALGASTDFEEQAPAADGKQVKKTFITRLNMQEIFFASPVIYSILIIMSMVSLIIWLYSMFSFRLKDMMNKNIINQLQQLLLLKKYDEAVRFCQENSRSLFANIIASGIMVRKFGPQFMLETIKSEGRRATVSSWQRISLLNDIILIAPMLGLLGTVIGMFYAFYNINRSMESIASLFDGLGIAVGTTVAGLIVAIIAMIFYSLLKYRLTKRLNAVEKEAVSLSNLIDNQNQD